MGPENNDTNHAGTWDIFIERILNMGYLVPGTLADLGRENQSWIVKWPQDGFKSNRVFRYLQFYGPLRTINDIPPMELHPSDGLNEVTVIMTDNNRYEISAEDLEQITCLNPGVYPVQDTSGSMKIFDLAIREEPMNAELLEAIRCLNINIRKFNTLLASPKRRQGFRSMSVMKKSPAELPFFNEVQGPGRLTKHVALLCGTNLAVAYKAEGRVVSRMEALRNMTRSIGFVTRIIQTIEGRWKAIEARMFFQSENDELRETFNRIRNQINLAENRRTTLGEEPDLSEEPIVQTLYPEGGLGFQDSPWYDYDAWCQPTRSASSCLQIRAKPVEVTARHWLNDEIIELKLTPGELKLFVSPLELVPEGYRDDEVKIGDIGFLVGHFLAIAERDVTQSRADAPLIMTNYLKIMGQEMVKVGRRGQNRGQAQEAPSHTIQTFK